MWREVLLVMLQASALLSGHFDNLENAFVLQESLMKAINFTIRTDFDSQNIGMTPGLEIEVDYNGGNVDESEPSGNIGEDYT